MENNYQPALLCLTHLLICADGVQHETEIDALKIIKDKEQISNKAFTEFEAFIKPKTEREIYQCGIDFLSRCSEAEKLKVFVTLYKLSEVDGRVHVKEIRLLLYSIKMTGIEFNDVVNLAMETPSII